MGQCTSLAGSNDEVEGLAFSAPPPDFKFKFPRQIIFPDTWPQQRKHLHKCLRSKACHLFHTAALILILA